MSSELPTSDASQREAQRALHWMRHERIEDALLSEISLCVQRKRRRRNARIMSVLTVALVLGLVGYSLRQDPVRKAPISTTATVTTPETKTLPDGSVIDLKEGASMTIEYSSASRRVALQSGEAYFQVSKDSRRPFVVETGGIQVRAVGTAFSVQRTATEVQVVVSEGRVAVNGPAESSSGTEANSSPAGPGPIATLDAGNRIALELAPGASPKPDVSVVTAEELADRLSWRVPLIEFSRTPLYEVVDLVNQYATSPRGLRFVLVDDSLREKKLTGLLRADNMNGFLRLLQNNFGVRTEEVGREIRLHKAP